MIAISREMCYNINCSIIWAISFVALSMCYYTRKDLRNQEK